MPDRTCRVCRRQAEKALLRRYVVTAQGILADPTGRADGRGLYTCSQACDQALAELIKKRGTKWMIKR